MKSEEMNSQESVLRPLVSIIVSCYNQDSYLAEALDSVLSQTFSDWECIIIDDGSTDRSEVIANGYVKKDNRFKYIYQQNQGIGIARNNAICQSNGKYILPLDGDDKIAPEYLMLAVPIMESDEAIGIVYCDVEMFGLSEGKLWLRSVNIRNTLSAAGCVNSSLFRRRDFEIIGGYKDYMRDGNEDWEFWISILELGVRAVKIDKVLFYYRIRPNSRDKSIIDRNKIFSAIVVHHAITYYEQYCLLLNDYERYHNDLLIQNTCNIVNERPLYRKITIIYLRLMNYLHFVLKLLHM